MGGSFGWNQPDPTIGEVAAIPAAIDADTKLAVTGC